MRGAHLLGYTPFSDAELTNVDFTGANLMGGRLILATSTGTVLANADARGVSDLQVGSADTQNFVWPDGHVDGLEIAADEEIRLWDLDPTLTPRYPRTPIGDIPILVEEAMSIDPAGKLRAVFEDDQWGSTITFEQGIPVTLDGTLDLLFDDDVNPLSLVGTSYKLFDWTGVTPIGDFNQIVYHLGTVWDTTALYTTGEVTLLSAVPEPSTLMLSCVALATGAALLRRW